MDPQVTVTFKLIRQLLSNRAYVDALRELESINPVLLSKNERGEYYVLRARVAVRLDDDRYLPADVDQAIEIFRDGSTALFSEAKYVRGVWLTIRGRYFEARQDLLEAHAGYLRCGDVAGSATALSRLSFAQIMVGDTNSAISNQRQCVDAFAGLRSSKNRIACAQTLYVYYFKAGRLTESLAGFNELDSAISDLGGRSCLIFHFNKALTLAALGQAPHALTEIAKCQQYLDDYPRERAIYYENLGFVHLVGNDLKKAEAALERGLQYARERDDAPALMVQIKRLFGDLYVARGEWDKAEQYTAEALALAEKIQERAEIAAGWRLQAQIDRIRGRRDSARERYREAIELFAQIGSQWELALTRQLAGGSGLFEEGERLAQLALARDYFASEKITDRVEAIDRLLSSLRTPRSRTTGISSSLPTIIAESKIMRDILSLAEDVARSEMNVLLLGPTGTGKDLLARYIHYHSGREGEFVSLNAAAVPDSMIESELFGHKKGAFTGAEDDRKGLLEQANGGTFYLNEVADASPVFQAKLLEVLETRKARRLGDDKTRPLTFRLIAACNYDLRERARQGDFRVDLFHRLNEIPIELPPLSARPEDMRPLVRHFMAEFEVNLEPSDEKVDQLAAILACFDYPGNVRELRSVVQRLAVQARGDINRLIEQAQSWNGLTDDEFLRRLLSRSGGRRTEVARVLGVSEATVRNRLRKLGVEQI